LIQGEDIADNWSQKQYHAHHDCPWTHSHPAKIAHIEVLPTMSNNVVN
jgi:hypothetical protein